MAAPKRTEPSQSLLAGKPYTNAASTDIRELFKRLKAEQAKLDEAPNVATLKRKATK